MIICLLLMLPLTLLMSLVASIISIALAVLLMMMLILIRYFVVAIAPLLFTNLLTFITALFSVPSYTKRDEFMWSVLLGITLNIMCIFFIHRYWLRTNDTLISIILHAMRDLPETILYSSIYIAMAMAVQNVTGAGEIISTVLGSLIAGPISTFYFLETDEVISYIRNEMQKMSGRIAENPQHRDIEQKHFSITHSLIRAGFFATSLAVIANRCITEQVSDTGQVGQVLEDERLISSAPLCTQHSAPCLLHGI